MTPALLNLIENKNKLYKEWDKDKTNELNKTNFLTYDKILKSLIRAAKNRYEYKQLSSSISKKMWQYVHSKLDINLKIGKLQIF